MPNVAVEGHLKKKINRDFRSREQPRFDERFFFLFRAVRLSTAECNDENSRTVANKNDSEWK